MEIEQPGPPTSVFPFGCHERLGMQEDWRSRAQEWTNKPSETLTRMTVLSSQPTAMVVLSGEGTCDQIVLALELRYCFGGLAIIFHSVMYVDEPIEKTVRGESLKDWYPCKSFNDRPFPPRRVYH